ncbi:uncharacterized protein LOC107719349 [Sinocyclocheilus rhinocerous]|uniref:uncharacterized protein LOC107719349 n=1 Tax=Sinocyclocheilus rhinocerous TaxID=307959 RepID=UPI0007B8049D|nr:PREDICTED: uncharacterized protein LOC107719349 [Sinocyclocheilus rhinocerous]
MASLYQEPDWSTKLETVKDNIIKRLSGPGVSWDDKSAKLKKYYMKDFFSLTDLWAVLFVTSYVKEIDEQTLTDQRDLHNEDPYPIYAVIDKQCKRREEGDPWFEISPHEAGYSLSGAFVETCNFGSQFDNGSKKKHQPEMDMLYLQAMCSSALADGEATWKWIKAISVPEIKSVLDKMEQDQSGGNASRTTQEPVGEDECYQELLNPVDADPSALEQSSRTKLTDLFGGQRQFGQTADKHKKTARCIAQRIWGRNYNFLHNMTDESVPAALLQKETRDLIDAGLLINSPYFSVLRKERNIDLIIALDYSDGDPFTTVREAAKTCKKLKIPFPEVNIPSDEGKKPKDFYVFKGQNAPTVIHIPLFNVVNCGVLECLEEAPMSLSELLLSFGLEKIDEQTLTDQRDLHNEDPYPIYAVIDKQCKRREEGDPWFEISPHEAGYSLSGAFVETCNFGSQFDNGSKKKHQPEMDMLYLQAMCSSALADGEATWKWIKAISVPEIKSVLDKMEQDQSGGNASRTTQEPVGEDECYQELLNPVDADPSALEQSSRTKLTDLFGGQRQFGQTADKHKKTARCIAQRIWGRNYNFLHNMTDESVPAALLQKETRDLIDAGLLINSPYFSVLRKERNIDLIIALDYSDGDPFTTVREAAKTCKKLKIPFPEVNIPSDEGKKPKDFYVFKGQNAPTVIHIPLFNVVNCGGKPGDWRKKYGILKGPYSAEMITEVMGVAGKNISNNIEKLLEQIRAVAEAK